MKDECYMGKSLMNNKCLTNVKELLLSTQTCTAYSTCQACSWDGERRHHSQEAGGAITPSNN